jgi:hypothetical protein
VFWICVFLHDIEMGAGKIMRVVWLRSMYEFHSVSQWCPTTESRCTVPSCSVIYITFSASHNVYLRSSPRRHFKIVRCNACSFHESSLPLLNNTLTLHTRLRTYRFQQCRTNRVSTPYRILDLPVELLSGFKRDKKNDYTQVRFSGISVNFIYLLRGHLFLIGSVSNCGW